MAGATQWYVRSFGARSSLFSQGQQLPVFAEQGHGFIGHFLRESRALWLPDRVADRVQVHQARFVKPERSLRVKDFADRIVQPGHADLATLHGAHHSVE